MNNYLKAVIVAVVGILYYLWWKNPHPNFPPGPKGVPILGVSLSFGNYIQRDLKNWSLAYGPVMSVRIGTRTQVILNTYDAIKEAFVDKAPNVDGRPSVALFEEAQGQYGLLLLDYPNDYPAQRTFGHEALVKLGMGGNGMEQIIHEETNYLISHLAAKSGKLLDLRWDLYSATTNVLARVSFGKRYEYDNKIYQDFLQLLKSSLVDPEEAKLIFVVSNIPFLRHFPPFSGAQNRFVKRFKDLHDFIRKEQKKHRKSFNAERLKDFMDYFIHQQMQLGDKALKSRFSDQQLVAYVRDLFGGGAETTGQELYWAILCALLHPDYTKLVLGEIDTVVGKTRFLSYEDRHKMPFTSAFLEETWRISTPIEKSIDHRAMEDVTLAGFDIPKDTEVVANQWGSNHDPVTFPDPRNFNPHRHIGKDGKMKNPTKVISLGLGMHYCIGKEIARMKVFLIFTRLLQMFEIAPQKEPLPTLYDTNSGLTNNPRDYKVILNPRPYTKS